MGSPRFPLLTRLWLFGIFAVVASAAPAGAHVGNSALPKFADNKPSVLVSRFSGVVERTGLATVFLCTSLDTVPVHIGVEVFDAGGVLLNSVQGGMGAVLNVAPGGTATFSTAATAAFLESSIVLAPPLNEVSQGSARVVATSGAVRCSAMLAAEGSTPPVSLSTLAVAIAPVAGAIPTTVALPQFSDLKTATHSILFPGTIKRFSMETAVFCTSLASGPIDVGVQVLGSDGIVANNIGAGNGALINVQPGQTVTFGTTGTAALLETSVIALPSISQGVARVVSTSAQLLCSAASLDSVLSPPTSMSNLVGYGVGASSGGATLPDALPQFSNGHASVHVMTVPGVLKRDQLQTLFMCTSLASAPVDIGVQIFDLGGTLLNDVSAGIGAVLNVPPGGTTTIATSATAAYLESGVIPLMNGLQGIGRVVASASGVTCSVMVVDDLFSPPTSAFTIGAGVRPGLGAAPSTVPLPQFGDGHAATHAAYFPGVVKRLDVETDIFCSSLAAGPIDIGVQIFNPDGTLANDVPAGNGALLAVAPGSTVSFGTTGTAALLESKVISLSGVAQGMARVVSDSGDLVCSALVLDAALNPPSTMTALAGFAPSCGDGILQPGEQCDGSNAAACPGNCNSSCLCPAVCGDGFLQTGEGCDDGNTVAGDCCSGSCQTECNDGNVCTQDTCNPTNGACTNDEAPAIACLPAGKSSFQLKKGATDEKDQLKWTWGAGPLLSQNDFGDPDTTATYTLCVYDSSGGSTSLATALEIGPSLLWIDKTPKGWSFADKAKTFDGVSKAQLRPGAAGKSKAQVKAGGINIPMPVPASASQYFAQQPNVSVQLVNNQTATCMGATYTTATTNDGVQFKTKMP